jgi:hypothetical protein
MTIRLGDKMTQGVLNAHRRVLLQAAVGMTGGIALGIPAGHAGMPLPTANGKAGDFDFLTGEWTMHNRKLNGAQWEEFAGEATVIGMLGGIASVEELRIPARNFSGMGLRLLDVERNLWADYWVNAKTGVLTPPPSWGSFVAGVGTWDSEENEGDQPTVYRGVWDQITPKSCRWYQAASTDAGKTWKTSWSMDWTRVP